MVRVPSTPGMMLDHFQGFDQIDTGWCTFAQWDLDVRQSCKTAGPAMCIHIELNPVGFEDAFSPRGMIPTVQEHTQPEEGDWVNRKEKRISSG